MLEHFFALLVKHRSSLSRGASQHLSLQQWSAVLRGLALSASTQSSAPASASASSATSAQTAVSLLEVSALLWSFKALSDALHEVIAHHRLLYTNLRDACSAEGADAKERMSVALSALERVSTVAVAVKETWDHKLGTLFPAAHVSVVDAAQLALVTAGSGPLLVQLRETARSLQEVSLAPRSLSSRVVACS